jgi:hypothetical protein
MIAFAIRFIYQDCSIVLIFIAWLLICVFRFGSESGIALEAEGVLGILYYSFYLSSSRMIKVNFIWIKS